MYKRLLQLPLFQGLSKQDFTEIIEKVVFQFKSFPAKDLIAQQGETCNKLIYVLNGSICKQSQLSTQEYTIEEELSTPILIEPQSVFGLSTKYQASYSCLTDADVMIIDKKYVLSDLMHYSIFELNYINLLSSLIHAQHKLLWEDKQSNDLSDRFKRFVSSRMEYKSSPLTLYIKMEDLAFQLNDTRLNVSRMLNAFEDEGKVELKRKVIHIPNPSLL